MFSSFVYGKGLGVVVFGRIEILVVEFLNLLFVRKSWVFWRNGRRRVALGEE